MRVLAVDPGGTTGWALWDGESAYVQWGQIPGGIDGVASLAEYMGYADVVVIEKYTIGGRTVKFSRQTDALEITGALKYRARERSIEVVMQQPAEAKRLFTDERLRAHGWWAVGEEHARDALRHLGFYLARKRIIKITGVHSA